MEINKEELFKLYMEWVDEVCEVCDWKTQFRPQEIIHAVASILEEHPELINNKQE